MITRSASPPLLNPPSGRYSLFYQMRLQTWLSIISDAPPDEIIYHIRYAAWLYYWLYQVRCRTSVPPDDQKRRSLFFSLFDSEEHFFRIIVVMSLSTEDVQLNYRRRCVFRCSIRRSISIGSLNLSCDVIVFNHCCHQVIEFERVHIKQQPPVWTTVPTHHITW